MSRVPQPPRGLLVLAFTSVYLAWGSTYLAIRVAVASIPVTVLAGVRFTIAGGGMLLALRLVGRPTRVRGHDFRALLLVAALLLIGGNGLVVWAEQEVPSGLAALIVATVPLWMAGLAALPPTHERLPTRAVLGLGLGFLGVVVLVGPALDGPRGELRGEAALVLASLSWSCGSLYARRAGIRLDPLAATGWEMLLGGLLFLALAVVNGSWRAMHPTPAGIAALAYLVVLGSWIGFTAYIWLLAHAPAAKVATYAYVNPVIAVLLGWWILDEPITGTVIAGSAIVVVAVALVTAARVRRADAPGAGTAQPAPPLVTAAKHGRARREQIVRVDS